MTSRRGFLLGLGSVLITAPAIVRAGSLMPIKLVVDDGIALQAAAHPVRYLGDVVMNADGTIAGIWNGIRVLTYNEVIRPASLETGWLDPAKMRRDGFRIIPR